MIKVTIDNQELEVAEGTGWVSQIMKRIEAGHGRERDLEILDSVCQNMMNGRTICVFADALAILVLSYLKKIRHEFEEHIKRGKCPAMSLREA